MHHPECRPDSAQCDPTVVERVLGLLVAELGRPVVDPRHMLVDGHCCVEDFVGQAELGDGVEDAQQRHREAAGVWECRTRFVKVGGSAGL